jgi:uncharacterized cupin superfamily protein
VSVVEGPAAVLDGSEGPTRWTELGVTGAGEVGIWEIDPGTVHDVEVDEVFVVLTGRCTIRVEGWPEVEVGPGDVVRLRAGAMTTWVVHERLRKVYVSWSDPPA